MSLLLYRSSVLRSIRAITVTPNADDFFDSRLPITSPFDGFDDALYHVARDVGGYPGVFLQPPGRVCVPILAVGDVHPDLVAGVDEDPAQGLVYPQEHLELVPVPAKPQLVGQPQGVPDQVLVVRRHPDVAARRHQLPQQVHEVLAHDVEVLVGDLAGLDVDALAQPDRDPGLREALDVFEAAPHVRLDHGPRVPVAPVEVEGRVYGDTCVRRVLHVHAHEAAPFGRVGHDLLQVRPAQILVQVQSEGRELYRDPGIQVVLVQGVEDEFVLPQRLRYVLLRRRALAEYVHRRSAALLVEVPDHGQRLFQAR